jgi:hypothetical protein
LLFVTLAAFIFLADRAFNRGDPRDLRIDVTEIQVQRLQDLWRAQMGAPPSPQQLHGLVEDWIKEEIYYREAMQLGLDEDDTIVRRRLAQKLEFLTEDTAANEIPDYRSKLKYYNENIDQYRTPVRYSFSHVYFGAEQTDPSDRINQARTALSRGANYRELGDPFMLNLSYGQRTQKDIISLFGREFADAVAFLPIEEWAGPVRSAYGLHLVRVESKTEAVTPSYAEVQDKVREDYLAHRRGLVKEEYYRKLRERYQIHYQQPLAVAGGQS